MVRRSVEAFLEAAFDSITQQSGEVNRVTVEANRQVIPDDAEVAELTNEMIRCLSEQLATSVNVNSPQGHEILIPKAFPLLKKYLQSITLFGDRGIGSWIQVLPVGTVLEH